MSDERFDLSDRPVSIENVRGFLEVVRSALGRVITDLEGVRRGIEGVLDSGRRSEPDPDDGGEL
jgi:hypothetical protein